MESGELKALRDGAELTTVLLDEIEQLGSALAGATAQAERFRGERDVENRRFMNMHGDVEVYLRAYSEGDTEWEMATAILDRTERREEGEHA